MSKYAIPRSASYIHDRALSTAALGDAEFKILFSKVGSGKIGSRYKDLNSRPGVSGFISPAPKIYKIYLYSADTRQFFYF